MGKEKTAAPGRLWGEALGIAAVFFLALFVSQFIGVLVYGTYLATQGQQFDLADLGLVAKIAFLSLPLATILTLAATFKVLKARNIDWRTVGLKIPQNLPMTFLIGVGIFLASTVVSALVNSGMGALGYEQDLSLFEFLPGDTVMYIYMITVISWFSAGFAEEFVFRGVIMGNIAKALGDSDRAWLWAAVIQATIFGLFHAYQGVNGIVTTASLALVFGLFYFKLRNLWPIIIAHGLIDVLGITVLYLEADIPV